MTEHGLINSPNFAFLQQHDPLLVKYAARAERYVFDDPNTALFKLRQFAEHLAQLAADGAGIKTEPTDSFLDILRFLRDRQIASAEIVELFHGVRRAGNEAAHAHFDDRRQALHQLKLARRLGIWFHRLFTRQSKFDPGPFIPPPDPAKASQELLSELDELRNQLATREAQLADVRNQAEAIAQQKQLAEQQAREAYANEAAALELAAETEEQLRREREEWQTRREEWQTEAAEADEATMAAVIEQAKEVSQSFDLDEDETRYLIDQKLRAAGWEVDSKAMRYAKGTRPVKGRNMAIAEWPTKTGPADYVLFVGLTPVATVEAKRSNRNCSSAIEQAKRYSRGYQPSNDHVSPGGPWEKFQIPFMFSTNGRPFLRQIKELSGIWFLDGRQPTNHARPLEDWYTPEGLAQLLGQNIDEANQKLEHEPTDYLPLRDYQAEAIREIETQIANGRQDMLVAMATGTGKTMTCIGLVYRLIKSGRFRRVLFLVDRSALGEQSSNAFKDVRLENHQTFADIYDVKELGDLAPTADTRLHIATVQGMVKRILYADESAPPVPVDWYDCIVVDECHRGYNLDQEMTDTELTYRSEADYISKYRRVIDHFDAVRIGLTATPALHTTEIFGRPVYQYTYRQAVIDGWLVDHEPPYRLITALSEDGMKWERDEEMKVLDAKTSQIELFNTPDEVEVEIDEFNRKVLTENFNRAVCSTLADYIDPSLPGKTLVFCVNDLHADMVVGLLKDAFDEAYGGVHDDAVMKITGKADKPLQQIRRFKNEQLPNVVVTVDLLTTGIDVPAVTNIVFLRRVKSRILFEQMLGRATRLREDLYGPGQDKERFRIFDAVDLYAELKSVSEMKPVVTRANISIDQLILELGTIEDEEHRAQVKDQLLAKLQRKKLTESQEERLQTATGLNRAGLIKHVRKSEPAELAEWFQQTAAIASILSESTGGGAKYIISEHADELRRIERGYGNAVRPEDYLDAFRDYIQDHLNDLPALIVVTQRPRDLTRQQLRELRLALDQAGFTEASLRSAWQETTNQDVAASIIGYIRHVALGQPLVAHKDRVQAAMKQIMASRPWTEPQRKWLERIGKQLEQELIVDRDALDAGQFRQQGGFSRLNKVFKGELETILSDIAEAVWDAAI